MALAARVGARVRVFWEGEGEWFEGVVAAFSDAEHRLLIQYDDGEEQWEDADGDTPIEFLSTAGQQQQQEEEHDCDDDASPPPSPNYADDDYDADEADDDGAESPKKRPTPEEEESDDAAPFDETPAKRAAAVSEPPRLRQQQQQPARKPTLHANSAVFFRDEDTLRETCEALRREKQALTLEQQALAARAAANAQRAATLKRELRELKNCVTLASVLSRAPPPAVRRSAAPATAADWRERVLDRKLQNQQRRQQLAELGVCVQQQQQALQQRQRQCEQLRSRLAQVPRRDLCTLADLQVEIAALLEEKRALLAAAPKPMQQPPPLSAQAASARDGTFGWTHGSDDAKVALEKELGRLELACARAKDEIHRWKLSFERENARILPLQARRIALRQELARFEASDVLLRTVFLRLEPDANGTIAAQLAAEALLTLAPPDHPSSSFASADAVLAALQSQNALPAESESEAEARLAFADFVACFRCLFTQVPSRTHTAVS